MRPHLRFQGLQLHPKPRLVRLQPRLFRLQLLGSSLEAVEGWLGVGSVSVSVKRWGIEGGGGGEIAYTEMRWLPGEAGCHVLGLIRLGLCWFGLVWVGFILVWGREGR